YAAQRRSRWGDQPLTAPLRTRVIMGLSPVVDGVGRVAVGATSGASSGGHASRTRGKGGGGEPTCFHHGAIVTLVVECPPARCRESPAVWPARRPGLG